MPAKPRQRKILAIDWDVRTLRIVNALIGKRGVTIDRLLSVAIPTDVDSTDPEQMGAHIRRALDQEGIDTRHALVDIPRDQVILNTLTLPALSPDDLPGMVQIQIAKELPFSVSDAVIDFVAGTAQGAATTAEVLVAAVRREVLAQYEATFTAAGLKLDRIGLRPYANKLAVCELLKHAIPERVVFLDVGPVLSEISVLRQAQLTFSRAASVVIPSDMEDGPLLSMVRDGAPSSLGAAFENAQPDRAGVIHALVVELTRSIEAYRGRDAGALIDHVVIGGDLGIEEALAEAVQKRLGVTTEIYNPASSFGWEPDEGAAAGAFASTLGLVLGYARDDQTQFDFLHPKRTESVTQKRLKRAPVAAAVVLLFLAAGGVGVAQLTSDDRAALKRIEARIAELKKTETENRKFLDLIEGPEGIRAFDTKQHIWVDVLADAMAALPTNEEMILEQVDLNQKEDRIVFKTRSKNRDAALDVIRRLGEFRREDRSKPRFRASMGPQTEKAREKYPYSQDLRIDILDDGPAKRDAAAPSTDGGRS